MPCSSWRGAEADGLQVAAGVGLGQHHRAGHFAAREPRQNFVANRIAGEGVDRLGDALQPEHVHHRGVGPADDFGGHRVHQAGAIQPAVLPRQREAHHVGLREPIEVLLHQRMERDRAVVVQRVPLVVDLLGVRGDHFGGHLADDFQNAAIVIDRVGRVQRGIARGIVGRVDEIVLLQPGQFGQVDMIEQELDVVVIEKEIRHGETPRGLLRNRKRLPALSTVHYPLRRLPMPLPTAAADCHCPLPLSTAHYLDISLIDLIIIGITSLKSPTIP